ncbi:MAG: hypothetical protein ACP5N7_01210 [Candidatus Pacearchaeota archaeon]
MKTLLVTTYYNDRVKERDAEYITCIQNNIKNKAIDTIVILVEKGTFLPLNHPKVIWEWVDERPKFSSFVNSANKYKYGLSIISNTDICFDEYSIGLIKASIKENECYALSRWDIQLNGDVIHYNHRDSQDTWVFKGEIKKFNSDFFIGKCGIDNRIAHEISIAGYNVINPSKTIRSYHLHITGVRNYRRIESEVIKPPYKLIQPTYLGENLISDVSIDSNGNITKRPIVYHEVKLTEFDYAKQKKQMEDMLKEGNIPKSFLLTICIPTMHSRKKEYNELRNELMRQMIKHGLTSKIQIKDLLDDGYAPIGWKRNKLNIECNGHYVAHFDDDDFPHEDYCKDLIDAIESNYGIDLITFNVELTINGERPEKMYYHHKFTNNEKFVDGDTGVGYRNMMPSHLNVIKREKALEHAFLVYNKKDAKNRKERADNGSDVHYSFDMVRDKTLETFVHIDKVLYYYKYKNK